LLNGGFAPAPLSAAAARVCIAVFTTTWLVCVALLLVKFLLTDSERELAVANSA
jgi:hypothetical protein